MGHWRMGQQHLGQRSSLSIPVYAELWEGGGQGHMGVIFMNFHIVSNKLGLLYE
jgi:hypothetical protein